MRTLLALSALAAAVPAFAQDAPPPAPTFTREECAVWARELSFADSVARHDAKAFADHVHDGAVFDANSPTPTRGRAAIVDNWAGIIDGTALVLSWYPTAVAIGGEPDVALSTGPALIEVPDPNAKQRYSLTHFTSTWHRDKDGTWRVLMDAGTGPKPATDEQVAAFRAGRKTCPRG